MEKHQHQVYIISGPSGAGKTSVLKKLEMSHGIHEHVSCTTRKPRKGEVNGHDYYFVSQSDFNELDLLEYAEHSGNLYGVTESEFLRNLNKYSISAIVTEINGMQQIKQAFPECITTIFIRADRQDVVDRMAARGDSAEQIANRLAFDDEHDVWNNWTEYDYIIDNTGSIEEAVEAAMLIMGIPDALCKVS